MKSRVTTRLSELESTVVHHRHMLSVELATPDIGLSKVPCVSAELLAEGIVRLEFLAKLSTLYKTIQSVSKKHIRYTLLESVGADEG